jgi:hypothetical protein
LIEKESVLIEKVSGLGKSKWTGVLIEKVSG